MFNRIYRIDQLIDELNSRGYNNISIRRLARNNYQINRESQVLRLDLDEKDNIIVGKLHLLISIVEIRDPSK